jgi:hypothetical protein
MLLMIEYLVWYVDCARDCALRRTTTRPISNLQHSKSNVQAGGHVYALLQVFSKSSYFPLQLEACVKLSLGLNHFRETIFRTKF